MIEVGAYEAKTHLPRLLERVRRGERITITKHGVPVAMLVPPAGGEIKPVAAAVSELRRFRRGRTLGGVPLRDLNEDGRR